MSKRDDIISDLEEDFGMELDGNFDTSINGLCNGDVCRHSECDCWDNFSNAVEAQLEKQKAESDAEMLTMYKLYKAEVNYGLYIPEGNIIEDTEEYF